jgi:hypothetical protein
VKCHFAVPDVVEATVCRMCHVAFDPLVLSPAAALRAKNHLEDEKLIRALGSYAGTSAFNVDIRAEQTLRVLIEVLKIKKSKTKKLLRGSRARLRRSSFPMSSKYRGQGLSVKLPSGYPISWRRTRGDERRRYRSGEMTRKPT